MRGDSPETIEEVEVKIDWVVMDGLHNGLNPEEIKEILEDYKERVDKKI